MRWGTPWPEKSQAPAWLVEFLMRPPLWFKAMLYLAACLCFALAVRQVVRRDGYISRDEQRAMILIVATVEGVAAGVVLSRGWLSIPFLGDVVVGVVSGFLVVEVLRLGVPALADGVVDEREQLIGAWLGVILVGFAIPALAGLIAVSFPEGVDLAINLVATSMLLWTVIQEYGPGETFGEAVRLMDD